jgi:hypothetical protein
MGVARQTVVHPIFLDGLEPLASSVGYGSLGRGGELGYERGHVVVGGRSYEHALSTHPPARLLYHLTGAERLRCKVGLNDDVAQSGSHADFVVFADGREVARARDVPAGAPARALTAELGGTSRLELIVTTSHVGVGRRERGRGRARVLQGRLPVVRAELRLRDQDRRQMGCPDGPL